MKTRLESDDILIANYKHYHILSKLKPEQLLRALKAAREITYNVITYKRETRDVVNIWSHSLTGLICEEKAAEILGVEVDYHNYHDDRFYDIERGSYKYEVKYIPFDATHHKVSWVPVNHTYNGNDKKEREQWDIMLLFTIDDEDVKFYAWLGKDKYNEKSIVSKKNSNRIIIHKEHLNFDMDIPTSCSFNVEPYGHTAFGMDEQNNNIWVVKRHEKDSFLLIGEFKRKDGSLYTKSAIVDGNKLKTTYGINIYKFVNQHSDINNFSQNDEIDLMKGDETSVSSITELEMLLTAPPVDSFKLMKDELVDSTGHFLSDSSDDIAADTFKFLGISVD
jgi:hypothetical protein